MPLSPLASGLPAAHMAGGELDTALDLARLATTEVRAGAKKHAPAWLKQLLCTKQQHSDNAIMMSTIIVCIVIQAF